MFVTKKYLGEYTKVKKILFIIALLFPVIASSQQMCTVTVNLLNGDSSKLWNVQGVQGGKIVNRKVRPVITLTKVQFTSAATGGKIITNFNVPDTADANWIITLKLMRGTYCTLISNEIDILAPPNGFSVLVPDVPTATLASILSDTLKIPKGYAILMQSDTAALAAAVNAYLTAHPVTIDSAKFATTWRLLAMKSDSVKKAYDTLAAHKLALDGKQNVLPNGSLNYAWSMTGATTQGWALVATGTDQTARDSAREARQRVLNIEAGITPTTDIVARMAAGNAGNTAKADSVRSKTFADSLVQMSAALWRITGIKAQYVTDSLYLHLDASDTTHVTRTGTNMVTHWLDNSGHNWDYVAAQNPEPHVAYWHVDSLTGHPAIQNSSATYTPIFNEATGIKLKGAWEMSVVSKSYGHDFQFFTGYNPNDSNYISLDYSTSAYTTLISYKGTNAAFGAYSVPSKTASVKTIVHLANDSVYVYQNGVRLGNGSVIPMFNFFFNYIGNGSPSDISSYSEILLYHKVLSGAERDTTVAYLTRKWLTTYSTAAVDTLHLTLPDTLYGYTYSNARAANTGNCAELGFYHANSILTPNAENYEFSPQIVDIASGSTIDSGANYSTAWLWRPTNTGTYRYRSQIFDWRNYRTRADSCIIKISVGDSLAADKYILFIGDSWTDGSTDSTGWIAALRYLAGKKLHPVGTRDSLTTANEGYGGQTFPWFAGLAQGSSPWGDGSPFKPHVGDPLINIRSYFADSIKYKGVDYIVIELGINDCNISVGGAWGNLFTGATMIGYSLRAADSLINAFRTALPNVRIGLTTPAGPSDQAGAGALWNQYKIDAWQYKKAFHDFSDSLIHRFGTNGWRHMDNVQVIPTYAQIDTKHNFVRWQDATRNNARSFDGMLQRDYNFLSQNGIHASPPGYWQFADAVYGWLKSYDATTHTTGATLPDISPRVIGSGGLVASDTISLGARLASVVVTANSALAKSDSASTVPSFAKYMTPYGAYSMILAMTSTFITSSALSPYRLIADTAKPAGNPTWSLVRGEIADTLNLVFGAGPRKLPLTKLPGGTLSQVLKMTAGGVIAWAPDSAGSGGSGLSQAQVSATIDSGAVRQAALTAQLALKADTARLAAQDSITLTRSPTLDSIPAWKAVGRLYGTFRVTLDANDTLALSGMINGQIVSLAVTNGGSYTLAFKGVAWDTGGTAPVQTSGTGKRDVYTFIKTGNVIYGGVRQNFVGGL